MDRDIVFLVYEDREDEKSVSRDCYAIYQTSEPSRFLQPLALAAVAAYVAVPDWAVPIAWSGSLPTLSRLTPQDYQKWMGRDGGFVSAMYAAVVACHVQGKLKLKIGSGKGAIARLIGKQQPSTTVFLPGVKGPRQLDLVALANALAGSHDLLIDQLIVHGLRALAFNLVFRKLSLTGYKSPAAKSSFLNSLSRALLYNVTLREVDFSNTNLQGLGDAIGKAWAMNAQPLISRINFRNCKLTNADLRGLLVGLSRIWCGGTALMESINFAGNPDIPTTTWDLFFGTFVDPSRLPFWPKSPPPTPCLAFLQELNLLDTKAAGPGLVRLAAKLSGLRTLKLQCFGSGAAEVLHSLSVAKAPLQTLFAKNFSDSSTLPVLAFSDTLTVVAFDGFKGNATPLLCGWPKPMPKLSIRFSGQLSQAVCSTPDGNGFAPGAMTVDNVSLFGDNVARKVLPTQATGLKRLVLSKMYYWNLSEAAPMLALCGLETLHLHPKDAVPISRDSEAFWTALASSKTLKDLQITDQLGGSPNVVAMIGRFLKTNRSVARISFDSPYLALDVESVKTLRSAFYGNKKVTQLPYLHKTQNFTMENIKRETARQLNEVRRCKAKIKTIFKAHYSKYKRNWRDKPNQLKLPYVERIRIAKRKIGKMQRDSAKIGQLLKEINHCLVRNRGEQRAIQEEKGMVRLTRRERQLKQLALKKKKFVVNLVTKLHKAKKRGRQGKSAKTQVPRAAYYRGRDTWPSASDPHRRPPRGVHSRYRYYNDPYNTRYHWGYGYYAYQNHAWHEDYLNEDDSSVLVDVSDTCKEPEPGAPVSDDGPRLEVEGGDDIVQPGETTCSQPEATTGWGELLSDVEALSPAVGDPWENMDSLIQMAADPAVVLSQEYLSEVHAEASELGVDVVSSISATLDSGAVVDAKIVELAGQTNTSVETVERVMLDPSSDAAVDFAVLQSTLEDLPDYDNSIGAEAQDRSLDDLPDYEKGIEVEADDAVAMYAGAGPRDLDDGGPSFGGWGNAALAGARRRARARKEERKQKRVRESAIHSHTGYKRLALKHEKRKSASHEVNPWPDDVVGSWKLETTTQQVKAMAESDLLQLPEVSERAPKIVAEWTGEASTRGADIVVVLVTQCSLDRLSNLEAQLTLWTGKASIALYLKPGECRVEAERAIFSRIRHARNATKKAPGKAGAFDVAVTIVEGCIDDEAYPINYLRNVALLEARNQHLRSHGSLESSAVLLVDVDFRPSPNLHETLHSQSAAEMILQDRRVVVCPAFESMVPRCPESLVELKMSIERERSGGVSSVSLSARPFADVVQKILGRVTPMPRRGSPAIMEPKLPSCILKTLRTLRCYGF